MENERRRIIRLSWDEWRNSRKARMEALAKKGLLAPCRRTTAKPQAIAALDAFRAKSATP